ncbi:MAG: M2 family metallopeptidase [Myxococcales bacterium]
MRRLALCLLSAGCASARPAPTPAAPSPTASAPTLAEARAFFDGVNADLRKLWVARDRAAWVNENFLTEDTDALAADGEAATAAYMAKAIPASRRFAKLQLPPDLARMAYLLSISQTIPAPDDPAKRDELAGIEEWLQSTYGKGTYCSPREKGKCLHLDDLEQILAKDRNWDDLVDAWTGWHDVAKPMRGKYERYVKLANEGAKQIGFEDVGALWRSGYDMSPAAFEQDEERLWEQVKPLYQALHCYVRRRLHQKYGDRVPAKGPIPVPALGNMWGQEWTDIYDLVAPYPKEPSLNVGKKLVQKKETPVQMVKLAEGFFTSLGFPPLPETFWKRSLLARPRDRDVVCHASAWDVQWDGDLRIKVCVQPTEDDLVTLHHELGHDFYFQSYDTLPILFQQGANDGFHEGIGDTIALSVTPAYLHQLGLLDRTSASDKARINQLMKRALFKVAFLPFGLLIDQWRWDVFDGKVDPAHYNAAWWELRRKYQGEVPPSPRDESDFDPGAKYHITSSTPYARYFLAAIYQFQFHRALCQAAGFKGPLDECSVYGNKAAGAKLRAMLSLGASKPWPDAMEALTGQRQADASAIEDYFAPLKAWLDKENAGQQCGW